MSALPSHTRLRAHLTRKEIGGPSRAAHADHRASGAPGSSTELLGQASTIRLASGSWAKGRSLGLRATGSHRLDWMSERSARPLESTAAAGRTSQREGCAVVSGCITGKHAGPRSAGCTGPAPSVTRTSTTRPCSLVWIRTPADDWDATPSRAACDDVLKARAIPLTVRPLPSKPVMCTDQARRCAMATPPRAPDHVDIIRA